MTDYFPSTHKMRTANSCGPDAIKYATKRSYDDVDKAFGHIDINNFQNVTDTPWNHFMALKNLGIPFQIVNLGDVLAGRCENEQTIILIHDLAKPLLYQHWVVLHSVDKDFVRIHYGNNTVQKVPVNEFKRFYSGGKFIGPQCAYEIGKGDTEIPWYIKWYAKSTGRFSS